MNKTYKDSYGRDWSTQTGEEVRANVVACQSMLTCNDYRGLYYNLLGAFSWTDSPQGADYWATKINLIGDHWEGPPMSDEDKKDLHTELTSVWFIAYKNKVEPADG